jgi:hypothetical protein
MDLQAHGISKWNMVKLCFLIFFRANFMGVGAILCQFVPFCIVVVTASLLS